MLRAHSILEIYNIKLYEECKKEIDDYNDDRDM